MTKKNALAMDRDPLAAIRALQDLDQEHAIHSEDPLSPEFTENKQVNKLTNQTNNSLTNLLTDDPESVPPVLPPDPLTGAILAEIGRPYRQDEKPERELIAGRVRKDVAERFDLACTLLKRDRREKQEVLDKALEMFLAHLVASQGKIDW